MRVAVILLCLFCGFCFALFGAAVSVVFAYDWFLCFSFCCVAVVFRFVWCRFACESFGSLGLFLFCSGVSWVGRLSL